MFLKCAFFVPDHDFQRLLKSSTFSNFLKEPFGKTGLEKDSLIQEICARPENLIERIKEVFVAHYFTI